VSHAPSCTPSSVSHAPSCTPSSVSHTYASANLVCHGGASRHVLVAFACAHAADVTAARFVGGDDERTSIAPLAMSLSGARYLAVIALRLPLVVITASWCTLGGNVGRADSSAYSSDGCDLVFIASAT
jgi:hypothetical protein